jgi:hypothetical protein
MNTNDAGASSYLDRRREAKELAELGRKVQREGNVNFFVLYFRHGLIIHRVGYFHAPGAEAAVCKSGPHTDSGGMHCLFTPGLDFRLGDSVSSEERYQAVRLLGASFGRKAHRSHQTPRIASVE